MNILTAEERAHKIVKETDGFKGIQFYVEIKEVEDMIAAAIRDAEQAQREQDAQIAIQLAIRNGHMETAAKIADAIRAQGDIKP